MNKSAFEKLNKGANSDMSPLSTFAGLVSKFDYTGKIQKILEENNSSLLARLKNIQSCHTVAQVNAVIGDLYSAYSILSASFSDEDLLGGEAMSV